MIPPSKFEFGALLCAALAPGYWLAVWKVPGAASLATGAYTMYLTHKQMIHLAKKVIGSKVNLAATGVLWDYAPLVLEAYYVVFSQYYAPD